MSRTARAAWKRLRERILERDGWRCTRCGKSGMLECDHVVPVVAGGTDAPENLRALCRGCHIARHRRPLTPAEAEWASYLKRFS